MTSQPVRSGDERGEPRAKRPGRRPAAAVAGAVAATALVSAAAVTVFHPSTAGSVAPVTHRPMSAATTSPAAAAVVDGADPTVPGCGGGGRRCRPDRPRLRRRWSTVPTRPPAAAPPTP